MTPAVNCGFHRLVGRDFHRWQISKNQFLPFSNPVLASLTNWNPLHNLFFHTIEPVHV